MRRVPFMAQIIGECALLRDSVPLTGPSRLAP